MIRMLLLIMILGCPFVLWGQQKSLQEAMDSVVMHYGVKRHDASSYVLDIDKDGLQDSIVQNFYHSPGFPYRKVSVYKGGSQDTLFWSMDYAKSSPMAVGLVHPDWLLPENEAFYRMLVEVFLVDQQPSDHTLDWILSLSIIKPKTWSMELMERYVKYNVNWISGSLQLPGSFAQVWSPQQVQQYYDMHATHAKGYIPEWYEPGETMALFDYRGHKFWNTYGLQSQKLPYYMDTVAVAPNLSDKPIEALVIKHGVAIRRTDSDTYQWAFLSNTRYTEGAYKMMWPTILDVLLLDDYVFILQACPSDNEYNLWVVDYSRGIIGKVRDTNSLYDAETGSPALHYNNRLITLQYEKGKNVWSVDELIEEVRRVKITE